MTTDLVSFKPLPQNYIDEISGGTWVLESKYNFDGVQTMLSLTELRMLEWLGRTFPFEKNETAVDGGAFLGGSTRALAAGLYQNAAVKAASALIHSYDMFKAPADHISLGFIGDRAIGSSVLDIFLKNIQQYQSLVEVHVGDFENSIAPEAIGILFVDVAKSWRLNSVVIDRFFTRLIPGRSIVIQQDHNDHSCVWLNITMAYFSEHFEYLTDDGSSRIFLFTKSFEDDAPSRLLDRLTVNQKIELALKAADHSKNPISAYLSRVSAAWMIAERDTAEAKTFLERIESEQPWQSDVPYVSLVRSSLDISKGELPTNYFGPTLSTTTSFSS